MGVTYFLKEKEKWKPNSEVLTRDLSLYELDYFYAYINKMEIS